MYRLLCEHARQKTIDLVHITIPSNYQALLGRLFWENHRIPYIVDYIDPWVPESDQGVGFLSKAWTSFKLAELLEPVAVARVSGIAGITKGYFSGVVHRNPHLRDVPKFAYKMGCSQVDYEKARQLHVPVRRLEKNCLEQQIVYAGALLPKAVEPMRCLLQALAIANSSKLRDHPIRLICLGTGNAKDDPSSYQVLPIAHAAGAEKWVLEYPERHPYLEVLATLAAADGLLIVGSTEPHYSPSKLFETILARRPLLVLLHRQSEATEILNNAGGGTAVTFDSTLDKTQLIKECVRVFSNWPTSTPPFVNWESLSCYDMAYHAGKLTDFYNEVIAYHEKVNS